jgi:hypothetical protein
MARSKLPRYGPYYRKCHRDPSEIQKVVGSKQIWGRRRGNYYAGFVPAVKALIDALQPGEIGYEFYTDIEPDPESWCVPREQEWSEGRPGVLVLEANELVAIPVTVTKRQDPEES